MLGAGVAGEGTKKKVKRRGRKVGGSREKKSKRDLRKSNGRKVRMTT